MLYNIGKIKSVMKDRFFFYVYECLLRPVYKM